MNDRAHPAPSTPWGRRKDVPLSTMSVSSKGPKIGAWQPTGAAKAGWSPGPNSRTDRRRKPRPRRSEQPRPRRPNRSDRPAGQPRPHVFGTAPGRCPAPQSAPATSVTSAADEPPRLMMGEADPNHTHYPGPAQNEAPTRASLPREPAWPRVRRQSRPNLRLSGAPWPGCSDRAAPRGCDRDRAVLTRRPAAGTQMAV